MWRSTPGGRAVLSEVRALHGAEAGAGMGAGALKHLNQSFKSVRFCFDMPVPEPAPAQSGFEAAVAGSRDPRLVGSLLGSGGVERTWPSRSVCRGGDR